MNFAKKKLLNVIKLTPLTVFLCLSGSKHNFEVNFFSRNSKIFVFFFGLLVRNLVTNEFVVSAYCLQEILKTYFY